MECYIARFSACLSSHPKTRFNINNVNSLKLIFLFVFIRKSRKSQGEKKERKEKLETKTENFIIKTFPPPSLPGCCFRCSLFITSCTWSTDWRISSDLLICEWLVPARRKEMEIKVFESFWSESRQLGNREGNFFKLFVGFARKLSQKFLKWNHLIKW